MATQTKTTDPIDTTAEKVAELNEKATAKVAELNEKAAENTRKAGAAYLDSYEKVVVQFADGYEKAAGATKLEWLQTLATTQADFAREVTKAYTSAARDLVSSR